MRYVYLALRYYLIIRAPLPVTPFKIIYVFINNLGRSYVYELESYIVTRALGFMFYIT